MRHSCLFLLFAGCLALVGAGCKGSDKKITVGKPATQQRPTAFLLKKLQTPTLDNAKTLKAKADLYAEGDGQSISATANIIWIRDSALWLNVKKFGLEGARALITKDSFFLLNRLEKTFMARGLDYLQKEYGLPEGFAALQHTLLGKPWFFSDIQLQSALRDSLHCLEGNNTSCEAAYYLDEGAFRLRREAFVQRHGEQTLRLDFDGFADWPGGGQFPFLRRIEAKDPATGTMRLEIKLRDVELNQDVAFKFEPGSYKRI